MGNSAFGLRAYISAKLERQRTMSKSKERASVNSRAYFAHCKDCGEKELIVDVLPSAGFMERHATHRTETVVEAAELKPH